jgi:hypothetical protein
MESATKCTNLIVRCLLCTLCLQSCSLSILPGPLKLGFGPQAVPVQAWLAVKNVPLDTPSIDLDGRLVSGSICGIRRVHARRCPETRGPMKLGTDYGGSSAKRG